jgi:hypothetical protein
VTAGAVSYGDRPGFFIGRMLYGFEHNFLAFFLSSGRAIAWPENILVQQINLSTP